ncbi:hypothetical protein B0H14DRAFT_2620490 [Mycena olivaceomarginata]|nr:hypothetical protein B0H14DRAFT_2620490 [Mycena olivaceomarginata]
MLLAIRTLYGTDSEVPVTFITTCTFIAYTIAAAVVSLAPLDFAREPCLVRDKRCASKKCLSIDCSWGEESQVPDQLRASWNMHEPLGAVGLNWRIRPSPGTFIPTCVPQRKRRTDKYSSPSILNVDVRLCNKNSFRRPAATDFIGGSVSAQGFTPGMPPMILSVLLAIRAFYGTESKAPVTFIACAVVVSLVLARKPCLAREKSPGAGNLIAKVFGIGGRCLHRRPCTSLPLSEPSRPG